MMQAARINHCGRRGFRNHRFGTAAAFAGISPSGDIACLLVLSEDVVSAINLDRFSSYEHGRLREWPLPKAVLIMTLSPVQFVVPSGAMYALANRCRCAPVSVFAAHAGNL
jgi:hypothetical protein